MLVELKNGETLNGHLVSCDTYMNLTLREVVQTSPDGERFWRLSEAYVRGNNVGVLQEELEQLGLNLPARDGYGADNFQPQIKYLRLPDEIIDTVKEQQAAQQAAGGNHRGGHGGDRGGHRGGFSRGGRGQGRGQGHRGGRGGRGRGQ